MTFCIGVVYASFGSPTIRVDDTFTGWGYVVWPGLVIMTARDYVKGEAVTFDGTILGSGLVSGAGAQCGGLPYRWSLMYVHHLTVEVRSDGSYRVSVPDANEPVTDPTSGKPCYRVELLVHSATWTGQAPEAVAIP